ncbi:5-(carboxyamino)imidazole ribonucleotide synthase [Massilia sp. ZL223]|uniref:5-(carboxyamino)imidazole ribonucleotide synthase n=1 Tax=Massilia sp. ZL223 TaxID=2824904 RepID=UPI001B824BE1|nr:5-(carboxyamino)imidazole ribonucleotide synthase [Massilia sp. ZL223]MBQ5961412.1 5-(carboxyamino)imidazole ribonucleotide synthase [Massilia sp. ZL223]
MNDPFLPSANPSAWLGVMGGGQLGRMFAHAAQAMGYKVAVLEPAQDCPAGQVAERLINAGYSDAAGLAELARQCVAITTEFENVPADSMAWLGERSFVAPAASCVSIAQDRIAEKRFFVECAPTSGVMPAPHKTIASHADIEAIGDELLPGILKTVRMGYDGKGQVRVRSREDVRAAFDELKGVTCLLEKMLPLAYEVSVLTARGADGVSVVYPIAENVHRDGILFTTTVPGPNVSEACAQQAQDAARAIVAQLGYVGVLCIEFFVLADGSLVVNEMAPRPHNSGHYTIDACVTSQFAQQVRAMARLPLGDVRQHSPSVMLNILGDVWFEENSAGDATEAREPAWDKVLALPGANLHLYGKDDPRRGRKMGHVTFVAPTLAQAQDSLRQACLILGIPE